jgi:hypothetical protein
MYDHSVRMHIWFARAGKQKSFDAWILVSKRFALRKGRLSLCPKARGTIPAPFGLRILI